MAEPRLSRAGRVVPDRRGPALLIDAGCRATGCSGGACGRNAGDRVIPLRWLDVDGDVARVGERLELSVKAAGLTRAAWVCFGLPVVTLIGVSWLTDSLGAQLGLSGDTLAGVAGLLASAAVLGAVSRHGAELVRRLELTVNRLESAP